MRRRLCGGLWGRSSHFRRHRGVVFSATCRAGAASSAQNLIGIPNDFCRHSDLQRGGGYRGDAQRAAASLRSAAEDFEIVVVDDASADGTVERVESPRGANPGAYLEAPGAAGVGNCGARWMGGRAWGNLGCDGRGPSAPSGNPCRSCPGGSPAGGGPRDRQPLRARRWNLRLDMAAPLYFAYGYAHGRNRAAAQALNGW